MDRNFMYGNQIGVPTVQQFSALGSNQIPPPPVEETVTHLANLLLQQSAELRERSGSIASNLRGSIPSAVSGEPKEGPRSLIELLRLVSHQLGQALSEIERAQSAL